VPPFLPAALVGRAVAARSDQPKTLARRRADRDDAISRAATADYEGPGADRPSQLLTRMRRFFGLGSDPMGRG